MDDIFVEHIIAWISWALAAISNVRYSFGRRSPWDHGHMHDVGFTPFTANLPLTSIFWTITIVSQGIFLATAYPRTPRVLSRHYIANNLLLLLWSYLFSRAHYFWSEVVIILVFLNSLTSYIIHKSYAIRPLKDWLLVHVPTVVLPLTWGMYVVFWNGAVLFHARHIMSRLLANVLIWLFLIVPGFFVVVFGDWAFGLFNAWTTLAIGFGQLFTKVFALQWIFAFVITGILAILSGVVMVTRPRSAASGEQAPLLSDP